LIGQFGGGNESVKLLPVCCWLYGVIERIRPDALAGSAASRRFRNRRIGACVSGPAFDADAPHRCSDRSTFF
jgi:hypothetical protein